MPRERHIVHVDTDQIWQTWQAFLLRYYHDDVINFGRNLNRGVQTSLYINFGHVVSYDRTLSDMVINDFRTAHGNLSEAIGRILSTHFPTRPVYNDNINIRFSGFTNKTPIKMLRQDHLEKMVSIDGIVRQVNTTRPRYVDVVYRCTQCLNPTEPVPQYPFQPLVGPQRNCEHCQRKTRMELLDIRSRKIDHQYVRIQESPEGMSGGEQPQTADVDIVGDLCGKVFAGDHVTVNGVLKSYHRFIRGKMSPNLDFYISANNVEVREKQFSQIKLDDEERQQIEALSQEPDLFEKLIGSYAPSIYGHNEEKLAILLQMASGIPKTNPDGSKTRGDSHILLCGDPSTAKSKLIKYATLIAPRGIYTSGESSTKAGLTAAAVKDETGEGRWSLEAGAFVLADMGMAIVDEFDKMDDKDRTAMHSVMEGQTVDISKVGMTASLNARCSILAAANPKLARFDMMAPIAEQINLPTTILSRFDLIFPVSDIPDSNKDTLISSHILKLHSIGEKRARGMVVSTDEAIDVLPILDPTFLRKYISHTKTVFPMMNGEAREEIQSFYLRIRSQYDATKTVPITARQLEALIRLTEASARLRLSQTVEKQDVERVIGLVMFSLNKVAYDTDKGVFDSDMISGISKGRRDLLVFIENIIERYDPHSKAIKHQDLVRELINAGLVRNDLDADKKITDLIHSTMLIELPHKMYKRFT